MRFMSPFQPMIGGCAIGSSRRRRARYMRSPLAGHIVDHDLDRLEFRRRLAMMN
jgi:hypothetical protein